MRVRARRAGWAALSIVAVAGALLSAPPVQAAPSTPVELEATAAEPFTLVALPDIQNYTSASRAHQIRQQTQWVVDTRSGLNTQFVVQLGDLVSDWAWAGHWPYASDGMKVLDDNGVPNAVVPGNHDFDNATGAYDRYEQWFPASRYANANWTPSTARYGGYMGQDQFGDDPVDRGNMNNYSLFTAGGVDWLVLGLEWEAPQTAIDWADRVLAAHPDREVILFTHAFVNLPGSRRSVAQRPGGTPPEVLWQTFVRTHCQVRLVLNGHEHGGVLGESQRTDPNACGEPVHQILSNYQSRPNGGDGWLRYYTFDPAAETMTATTYSPVLGQYETDANSAFTLPFAFDDDGGPDPEPEPDPVLFSDSFSRSVANGWGTAESGATWTSTAPASAFSVDGSAGRMLVPAGQRRNIAPAGFSAADVSVHASLAVTPAATGSGVYTSVYTRLGTVGDYRATVQTRATGGPVLTLVRRIGSTETTLATYRMPTAPAVGESIGLRFEVEGSSPTTLRARLWQGATEPTTWHASASDASGPTAAGGLGLSTYVSSAATAPATLVVDRIAVTSVGTTPPPPANVPPTAAIQVVSQSERTVQVSGAGSTDTDGTVTSYAWTFGDGGTASGATASRTYAADGTYTIGLTVTDDDGATHTTTRTVTVAATPPPQAGAADAFGRTVTGGWGTADVGGAWTTAGAASVSSVADGVGRQALTVKGSTALSTLAGVSSRDGTLRADVAWNRSPSQGALYAAASPRSVNATTDYRCAVYIGSSGRPKLDVVRRAGGDTTLAYASLTALMFAPGQEYSLVCRVETVAGGTRISAKLYPAGTAEPSAWQVTAVDATPALQANGRVLLWSYLSSSAAASVTTSWDDLSLTP